MLGLRSRIGNRISSFFSRNGTNGKFDVVKLLEGKYSNFQELGEKLGKFNELILSEDYGGDLKRAIAKLKFARDMASKIRPELVTQYETSLTLAKYRDRFNDIKLLDKAKKAAQTDKYNPKTRAIMDAHLENLKSKLKFYNNFIQNYEGGIINNLYRKKAIQEWNTTYKSFRRKGIKITGEEYVTKRVESLMTKADKLYKLVSGLKEQNTTATRLKYCLELEEKFAKATGNNLHNFINQKLTAAEKNSGRGLENIILISTRGQIDGRLVEKHFTPYEIYAEGAGNLRNK